MNMMVSATIPATPNGTTRPQVRIVIVGHVDHASRPWSGGCCTETGSLPDGKLEMLKAVSARRGMPFEWSFLLDALQTERDQGITIDTTQIRFRTGSRDVVLIDAPGHAEFLRNMITGASQADGALLIIDAREGVRDQTRRHGYLLHLLGVKQVAVVVNKMDRVDFSAARFEEIKNEISAHLTGLGLMPSAVIPISARDGDGVTERTAKIRWYRGPTVVEALDALEPARPLQALALRMPVQAIYKFDDRRIVAGRIESGNLAAGDEIVIMPAGKIAKIRTVEGWPATPVKGAQSAGRSVGITLDRELFIERGDVIAHVEDSPRDTRRIRARIFWLHDKPLTTGASILVRVGTRETRASVVAIEKAVDPGELSSVENASIARNHVGEIDISLAQALAADPYTDNPRTGRLVIEVNGRIAGGGLVLSVDAGQRAIPVDIVPVESALRPDERSARYRHNGAVVWLTGCRLPENQRWHARWSAGCSAMAVRRCCWTAIRCGPASMATSDSPLPTAPRTFAGWLKSPPISPAMATSPSLPRFRRRWRIAPRHAASPTLCSVKSMSQRRPKYAKAATPRAITPRRARVRCMRSPASAMTTSRQPTAN
jgi:bifunctional enzyme CysN/CysC